MSGGYKDFVVQSDPNLKIEDDLSRRDFTINALAWDFYPVKSAKADGEAVFNRVNLKLSFYLFL